MKYPRTYHWITSPGVGSDDKIISTSKNIISREVIITEKIDGGCTKLYNGEVYARSVGGPAIDGWFAMVKKHHAWKTKDIPLQFFGEDIYGIHSIIYDAILENETFRLFNIFDGNYWLSWDDLIEWAELIGFITVPVLFRGVFNSIEELNDWIDKNKSKNSSLGGELEGFVIRVAESFKNEVFPTHVTKWVRANHVSTDSHWRNNWQPCALKTL